METDPVSKTLCSLVFRIPDNGQSPPQKKEKKSNSECYKTLSEPFRIYQYSGISAESWESLNKRDVHYKVTGQSIVTQ
jgi:hypothetical protein